MIKRSENGTPQGSVLNPVMFSIMINDLPDTISSPSALYADDFCLSESGSNIKQLEHLCQKSVSKIIHWPINLDLKSLHPKPLQFFSRKKQNFNQLNYFSYQPQFHCVKNINTPESPFKVMVSINHIYSTFLTNVKSGYIYSDFLKVLLGEQPRLLC